METKFKPKQEVFFLERNAVQKSTVIAVYVRIWADIWTDIYAKDLCYEETYAVSGSDVRFHDYELHETKGLLLNSL